MPITKPTRTSTESGGSVMTTNFEPVRTLEDLDSLDLDEIVAGYRSYEAGDPEPGPNRGRAFWHGWRNGREDLTGELDDAQRALAAEYGARMRAEAAVNGRRNRS